MPFAGKSLKVSDRSALVQGGLGSPRSRYRMAGGKLAKKAVIPAHPVTITFCKGSNVAQCRSYIAANGLRSSFPVQAIAQKCAAPTRS